MTSQQVANTPHEPLLEHVRPLLLRVTEMAALCAPPVHDTNPGTSLYLGIEGIAAALISPYPKRRPGRASSAAAVATLPLTASPLYGDFFRPRTPSLAATTVRELDFTRTSSQDPSHSPQPQVNTPLPLGTP